MQPLRIVIAADSALLRAGLARLLGDAGLDVVATARDEAELTRKARAHHPDVAVVALDEVPARIGRLPMLILAQSVDHDRAMDLLDESPSGLGYLLEHRIPDVDRFVSAVRQVASGGSVLDPAIVQQLLAHRAEKPGSPLTTLSEGELDVLRLMAEGYSNAGIGLATRLATGTVEKRIATVFMKLGLTEREDVNRRVRAVLLYLRESGTER